MLPGIMEILNGSVPLPSLVKFVLDRLCYVRDATVHLDSAKQNYYAIDGSSFTNCMDLMSTVTTQFNVCSNWKGAPFSDDSDRIDHFPGELSGGEQQRVALARAFVVKPALLLADEPTGNLDRETGQIVMNLLFDLQQEHGTTLVLVTHDEILASRCERSVRMIDGCLREENGSGS